MPSYFNIYYDPKTRYKTNYDENFVELLIKRFNLEPGKLLDIGCGNQTTMKLFEKKGFDVYGADLIEPENKNKFNIKCSNFESEEIQFDNNKFDIVFSKSVIEHLKNPNNIIKEALRVLKPGGKIILLTPSWLHTYWGPFYIDHTHVSPFTVSSLKNILLLNNFKVNSVDVFYQFPYVWKFSFLKYVCKFIALLPIPYFPVHHTEKKYNDILNIVIRFSNEPMLLADATKKN